MKPRRSPAHRVALGFGAVAGLLLGVSAVQAQPFLSFDFEDDDFSAFFSLAGLTLPCIQPDPLPSGTAAIDSGEVLMTNDELFGTCLFGLRPSFVEDNFPADAQDQRVRVRISPDAFVGEVAIFVRARAGIVEASGALDSTFERAYGFSLFPQFALSDPEFVDGAFGVSEWTDCHTAVDHPEWPNRRENDDLGLQDGDFSIVNPGFAVLPDDWYWVEISTQGDDNGGPVLLQGRIWPDGDDPPELPQLLVIDPDGLPHTPETLLSENNMQVLFGTSLVAAQQPLATARVDDLSLTELSGCPEAPVTVTRTLWGDRILVEGVPTALFEDGGSYTVTLTLSDRRPAGDCPAGMSISEQVPSGWTIESASNGGDISGETVTWSLDIPDPPLGLPTMTYTVGTDGVGTFSLRGIYIQDDSDYTFPVGGESVAISEEAIPPQVNDFGGIQHWLTLGPFTREVEGADPGDAEIRRDYLTDGVTTEANIRPEAGDTTEPDYTMAASTGLAPDTLGRNPDGVPTWVAWRDLDDDDDRIDFESIYGDLSDVMDYAVTYLNVLEEVTVNFGVSSDDSVHILLDGETLHVNNVARGALDRIYQDTLLTHPSLGNVLLTEGQHILMVKVFEGGGEHNFRVGFTDEFGMEIPGGPEEITISLEPEGPLPGPEFIRADANADGGINITDGIFVLNFLFLGGPTPPCMDAADPDDDGQVNITDGIYILNFLFLGGPNPVSPHPDCGEDLQGDDDGVSCESYPPCS